MGWSSSSSWQIVFSLVTPAAAALVILALEKRGPIAPALQRTTGLVAPYFTSIAILFGLFTALLMNDVWQKDTAARQSVQVEDDALRALIQLARTSNIEATLASGAVSGASVILYPESSFRDATLAEATVARATARQWLRPGAPDSVAAYLAGLWQSDADGKAKKNPDLARVRSFLRSP